MMGNMNKIVYYHLLAKKCQRLHIPLIPGLLQRMMRVLYSCELPNSATVASDVKFLHNGLGVVIHGDAIIGSGTVIGQNVTIGGRNGRGNPVIGRDVFIGAGGLILGGVTIGDGAKIGAGAIVLEDVPAGALAICEKARIIIPKNG